MKKNTAIAILGGMGPEASVKMLEIMVSMAAREFGAKDGTDFPEILLDSVPVPDFISNKKKMPIALEMLKERIIKLNAFNISTYGIACNTAHIILDELEAVSAAPFTSMIDAVSASLKNSKIRKVGILATLSTIETGLYQKALSKYSINVVFPNSIEINRMEKVIRKIIAGKNLVSDSEKIKEIAESLISRGAEGIILGCTELPLIFPKNFSLPVYDSLEILARSLLENYYGRSGL